jgi:uncharacterized lipoprotein YajG
MRHFVHYILFAALGIVFLTGCQAKKVSIWGPQGENHTITRRRKQVVGETVDFFKNVFGL